MSQTHARRPVISSTAEFVYVGIHSVCLHISSAIIQIQWVTEHGAAAKSLNKAYVVSCYPTVNWNHLLLHAAHSMSVYQISFHEIPLQCPRTAQAEC